MWGDSLILAYEPEPGAGGAVPFQVTELSHRFDTSALSPPMELAPLIEETYVPLAAAASCSVDVTCYPAYSAPASAVALMVFESGGGSYQCSGALIGSAAQPSAPFFLTANHCIATPAEARSLITFFNYQTPTCNGTPPARSTVPRVAGASFLAGEPMELGDFSLLQLTSFPNIDVRVLGWLSDDIAASEQVTGISHPRGDYKRIAFGQRTRDVTIRFTTGERMPASKGYQVAWFQGVTQSGSSGSPLLVSIGGREYVAGTLSAGPDVSQDDSAQVCRAVNLTASYGRFSAVFPYLAPFLTSTSGGGSTGSTIPVSGTLTANPNPISLEAGQILGRTVLSWETAGVAQVQIRVGSPSGTPMTGIEGPSGSATTGNWVGNGTLLYLQDASDGDSAGPAKTITSLRVNTISSGTTARSGVITATPNPITVTTGQILGVTTLSWQASGVSQVQIRVNSPAGPAMTGLERPTGSATTGNWVADGTVFYLQDASTGDSSGASKTIATVRVQVSRARLNVLR